MSKSFVDQVNETPVTYAVVLFYLTMAYLTRAFGFGVETGPLIDYGAAVGVLVQDGESWRLITHAFLHGGLIHLLLNMYALLVIGPPLERFMRTWRFILLYVVAAVGGCIVAQLVNEEYVPLVGGSGALFGMLGALVAFNIRGGRTLLDFLDNQGTRQLIAIIVINLLVGFFIPIVSNSAHVGGLIAGFVLVFCFLDVGRREKVDHTGRAIQAGWIAVLLSLLAYVTHPVLRFDYNLRMFLTEQDSERRVDVGRYLTLYDGDPREIATNLTSPNVAWLTASESEPKLGIQSVAHRESNRGPLYQRVIRRWKQRR